MDFSESTKVLYSRIQKLEPENVSKIIGYLLLQDNGERDMIRLAFSPDNSIHSLINKAKIHLGLSVSPPQPVFSPRPFSAQRAPASYWDPVVPVYSNSVPSDFCFENQLQLLSLEDQLESVNSVGSNFSTAVGPRANRRSPSLPDFPVKICHYFTKGFCKHGSQCRYFHGQTMHEMLNSNFNEIGNEDHIFLPGSLEKLEMEITELLKLRRGFPVSIASLPMLYCEKYGRTLQAEGYLTESQRHGKAGYSLTRLLARLNNSIRLIDSYRPHGQHAVILAEDVPKYMEYIGDVNEHGGIVANSRQIYLTFPAESNFNEQDVSNYFSKFGIVQDVRIPSQHKRMFGFVTFVYAETVRHILAKGNPHFVCGSRVLVKPYREKPRKCADKVQHPMYNDASQFLDAETEPHSMPRVGENSRLLRKKLIEEHEQLIEFESRRISDLNLAGKPLSRNSYFGYTMDEFNPSSQAHSEQFEFQLADQFSYLLDTSDKNVRRVNTKYNEQQSGGAVNLPDSPFASPIGSGISTATY